MPAMRARRRRLARALSAARSSAARRAASANWFPGSLTLKGVTPSRFDAGTLEEDGRKAERLGARILIPADAEWPGQLSDLAVPPLCLWVRGPIDLGFIYADSAQRHERGVA